jgi:hypothetical protein
MNLLVPGKNKVKVNIHARVVKSTRKVLELELSSIAILIKSSLGTE